MLKKRILSALLALIMVLTMLPVYAAAEILEGECGETCDWTLDTETGVLKINGLGAVEYTGSGERQPWYPYCSSITQIVVADGITEIPRYTFEYLRYVKTVRLPDTLEYLGCNAFNDCAALNDLVIPASVVGFTNGGNFNRCTSLTNIWYVGTREEWEQIEDYTNAEYYEEHTIHYLTLHEDGPDCPTHGQQPFYAYDGTENTVRYDLNKQRIACAACGGDAVEEEEPEPEQPVTAPVWSGTIAAQFAGGSGTEDDPYEIANGSQLARLNQIDTTGLYFVQTADIRLNDTADWENWASSAPANIWKPIRFKGHYDGQGHTISGVYMKSDNGLAGLFYVILEGSVLQNVHVVESYVYGDDRDNSVYSSVGSVVGTNYGTVENCSNSGWVGGTSSFEECGGVVGLNKGTVKHCVNSGTVSSAGSDIGGVVGQIYSGIVTDCFNSGAITGRLYTGGIVGETKSSNGVRNCFNAGTVTSKEAYAGGVAGTMVNWGTMENCFNSGNVSGQYYVGGVVGQNTSNESNTVKDCYYLDTCGAAGEGHYMTASQVSSGWVAYLLGEAWGQNIDNGKPNEGHPVLGGARVYLNGNDAFTNSDDFSGSGATGSAIWSGTVAVQFAGGSGTAEDPYEIANGSQLARLNQIDTTGLYFVQTADIRLNDTADWENWASSAPANIWKPIRFKGHYDGQGHTISGVYMKSDNGLAGLFYVILEGSVLQNVHVVESYVYGDDRDNSVYSSVGSVVGTNYGTVENCSNSGWVGGTSSFEECGGVVGLNKGTVKHCVNSGTVSSAGSDIGGVVGQIYSGIVTDCFNSGAITGRLYTGGIVGETKSSNGVRNCFNAGTVTSKEAYAGGVAGTMVNWGTMENCFNSGNVSGQYYVGGVVGQNTSNESNTVKDCYYLDTCGAAGEGHYMTASQVSSGWVAYLLGEAWGQNIDNGKPNEGHPVLGGARVYLNEDDVFTNHSHTIVIDEARDPTCTETGLTEGKHCSVCGRVLVKQKEIAALGHSYAAEVVKPTCTEFGYTTHTCQNCGISYQDTYVDALEHAWDSGVTTVAATCTREGTRTFTCENDPAHTRTETIPATGHKEQTVAGKAATCTRAGVSDGKRCSTCGEVLVKQETIPALGHKETTLAAKDPTCTGTGLAEGKKCSVCGVITVVQQTVPAAGHQEETLPGRDATCTETGLTDGKKCTVCGVITAARQTVPAKGHTEETVAGKAATCTETGLSDGKKCTVCGAITVKQQTVPAKGHTEQIVAGKAATCTASGLSDGKKCTVCGVTTVAQQTVPAAGHKETTLAARAATCTEAGLTEGRKCSVCGTITVKQQTVPALGHKETTLAAKAATCTATGLTEGKKCSVCGTVTVTQQTVPALGHIDSDKNARCDRCGAVMQCTTHEETALPGKATTCTEAGLTEGRKCSVCGTITVQQTTIPALGHKEQTLAGKAATCTEAGITEGKKCTICGTVTVRQETIPAKGHKERIIAGKDATCTQTGLTEGRTCTVCDTVTIRQTTIPAKGHKEVALAAKAPTCIDSGLTEGKKCSVCGTVTVQQQTVPAKGHSFGSWETVREPSSGKPGEEQRVCKACGHTETNPLIRILPGDVNLDDKVTPKDATVLRRYLAGWSGYTARVEEADVNGDGKITIMDVTILRRYLAGWSGITLRQQPKSLFLQAEQNTSGTFRCSSVSGRAGDTVTVDVLMENSPGIIAAALNIDYDPAKLELISAEDTGLLAGGVFSNDLHARPFRLTWEDGERGNDNTKNGVLAKLTFRIREDVQPGQAAVSVSCWEDTPYNAVLEPMNFTGAAGQVVIVNGGNATAAISGQTVTVTMADDVKPAWIWAALYDAQDRFVEIVMEPVTGPTAALTFQTKVEGTVKVIFLDSSKAPCLDALTPE